MFKIVMEYLNHLHHLIILAEDLSKEQLGAESGKAKKTKVISEFCIMLSDLPKEEMAKLPAFLKDPENIAMLVDFMVAIGNFVREKKGFNLMSVAKALLNGEE